MLTDAQKEQFDTFGYVLVDRMLPDATLADITRAAHVMGHEQPGRAAWNERSCFRREAFRRLLDAPALIESVRALVGDDLQLLQLDLLRSRPGEDVLEWHRDMSFVCDKTLAVSCAIYLQDTGLDQGPLCLVPHSHRWEQGPQPRSPQPDALSIPIAAGAAVIHNSALWHTATVNRSAADCWALFPIFGKYWIKRRDIGCLQPLPANLTTTTSPIKRQLLGLGLRPHLEPLLGDDQEYNLRGDAGIDFSDPTECDQLRAT